MTDMFFVKLMYANDVAIARFDSDGRVEAERRVNPLARRSSWCPTNYSTYMRMYVHNNSGKYQ